MNGPHDIGGMHNMEPIPIEENEPVFHSEWEAKVFAMSFATFGNYFPVDETRHASERMPPGQYLSSSYYERWLYALELLITEHNFVTKAEIEERINQLAQSKT
ncbi:SH3-like domain-containing protein [Gloeocapsopsis dulcis]|uniref:SH3-like domain-containing protein n=1 Tax=Gloeocapsopsis dulcis TaxID=2859516 RepID=UPI0018C7CD81|nr:SH3-like domain-containing protein [Gloeocapsopsis dulcis]WNN92334.1 nitrile hydratase subunit beta [Gloeocapsopsis dulcis]